MAYKIVPSVIFVWFLLIGHRFIFYSTATGACAAQSGVYEKYDAYFEVIVSGVCPPIILLVLGSMLLRSVRQIIHRRVLPSGAIPQAVGNNLSQIQQIDAQLTRMLLLQSFVAIPSFIPYGAQNLYSSITQNWYKSPLRAAWDNVIIEIIRLLSYVFYSTSFYISFASSRGFRAAFFQSILGKRAGHADDSVNNNDQPQSTSITRKIEQRRS